MKAYSASARLLLNTGFAVEGCPRALLVCAAINIFIVGKRGLRTNLECCRIGDLVERDPEFILQTPVAVEKLGSGFVQQPFDDAMAASGIDIQIFIQPKS